MEKCSYNSRIKHGGLASANLLCLWSHCQAFWRHASPPNTPVSCRSDSRPSPWPKLEASPWPFQQPMDWPATQGQQQHATSWPVEKIHHSWSFGNDATVLDDLRVDDDDDEFTEWSRPRLYRRTPDHGTHGSENVGIWTQNWLYITCLLYTSPSPRD